MRFRREIGDPRLCDNVCARARPRMHGQSLRSLTIGKSIRKSQVLQRVRGHTTNTALVHQRLKCGLWIFRVVCANTNNHRLASLLIIVFVFILMVAYFKSTSRNTDAQQEIQMHNIKSRREALMLSARGTPRGAPSRALAKAEHRMRQGLLLYRRRGSSWPYSECPGFGKSLRHAD